METIANIIKIFKLSLVQEHSFCDLIMDAENNVEYKFSSFN